MMDMTHNARDHPGFAFKEADPFLMLIGGRDVPIMAAYNEERKERCVLCGTRSHQLNMFSLHQPLCTPCYFFAININYPFDITKINSEFLPLEYRK